MKKYFCVCVLFFLFSFVIFASGSKDSDASIDCKETTSQELNDKKKIAEKEKPVEKKDPSSNYIEYKDCRIQIPKSAALGNFITVRFTSEKEIKNAYISFISESKKDVVTIKGFPINDEKTKWVAIASVVVWWKPGNWQIKTKFTQGKAVFEDLTPFVVANKKFPEFVMKLSKKNTNLLTKKSKKKAKQSNRFVEVITSKNFDAKLCPGPFIQPFKLGRISSYFAEKRIKKYPNGKSHTSRHWGMDYPAPKGTPIVAPADGKVVLAEKRIVTGNTVILEHLPGIYTLYYHLNEIYVKEGQFLKQGTKMAAIGSTGFSTGPHLHWELRINGKPTDVRYLLERNFY